MAEFGNEGSFVILWAGENPSVHVNLVEKLEANGIAFKDISLGDDEVAPTADPLPIDWKPRFGFEVTVLSTDYPAAKELLDNLLEREPEDLEIPAQPEVVDLSTTTPKANDATADLQVWKGTDTKLAEFLTSALSENNLVARVAKESGATAIYVAEGNQARALEIVREVTQGAPPK
ncbi:MAG TPA: hypothetical protein VK818_05855 [Methylomirabilota bacterium]|jgi:hypothetical protein|nr:hypothetical protein [Methylomirabilota bacterium]